MCRTARSISALVAAVAAFAASGGTAAAACSPLPCSKVLVAAPYDLDFARDHGNVLAGSGIGTGFTYVDAPSHGGGYAPERLRSGAGVLEIATGPGINYLDANSLENGLAVGVPSTATVFSVQTTIDRPARGTGNWEQAGLWLGADEDNYVKLVVVSHPRGLGIELLGEADGKSARESEGALFARRFIRVYGLERSKVNLVLRVDAGSGTVAGFFAVNGGDRRHVATFAPPPQVLNRQAASEPELAGARLAGVFATHRLGPQPLEYRFDDFAFACHQGNCTPSTPDPGPGAPPDNVIDPDSGEPTPNRPRGGTPGGSDSTRDGGAPVSVPGKAGSTAVSVRHPRRIRLSRLIARGLPVRLRCSDACSMRAKIRASRRWARSAGLVVKRRRLKLVGGRARLAARGNLVTRLKVRRRGEPRAKRARRARLALHVRVADAEGRTVLLRSAFVVKP